MEELREFVGKLTRFMKNHSRYIGEFEGPFEAWDPGKPFHASRSHEIIIWETAEARSLMNSSYMERYEGPEPWDFRKILDLFEQLERSNQYFAVRIWPEYERVQYEFVDHLNPDNRFKIFGEPRIYLRVFVASKIPERR